MLPYSSWHIAKFYVLTFMLRDFKYSRSILLFSFVYRFVLHLHVNVQCVIIALLDCRNNGEFMQSETSTHIPVVPNALEWCHNGCDGVLNHQPHDCLLNRLFRRRSKKTSKLRVTGLCKGNPPVTGGFPSQRASNAENFSIWWRHHGKGDKVNISVSQ